MCYLLRTKHEYRLCYGEPARGYVRASDGSLFSIEACLEILEGEGQVSVNKRFADDHRPVNGWADVAQNNGGIVVSEDIADYLLDGCDLEIDSFIEIGTLACFLSGSIKKYKSKHVDEKENPQDVIDELDATIDYKNGKIAELALDGNYAKVNNLQMSREIESLQKELERERAVIHNLKVLRDKKSNSISKLKSTVLGLSRENREQFSKIKSLTYDAGHAVQMHRGLAYHTAYLELDHERVNDEVGRLGDENAILREARELQCEYIGALLRGAAKAKKKRKQLKKEIVRLRKVCINLKEINNHE